MKIEIEIDDVEILESFEDYAQEYKPEARRRWGRMSWLYPGEMVIQIGDESAATIKRALELNSVIKKAEQNENTEQR
jgi:hypothetical protein